MRWPWAKQGEVDDLWRIVLGYQLVIALHMSPESWQIECVTCVHLSRSPGWDGYDEEIGYLCQECLAKVKHARRLHIPVYKRKPGKDAERCN